MPRTTRASPPTVPAAERAAIHTPYDGSTPGIVRGRRGRREGALRPQMAKRPEPHVPGRLCASLGRRMHLSGWQPRAPHRDSMAAKVMTPATEALELLGAGRDP